MDVVTYNKPAPLTTNLDSEQNGVLAKILASVANYFQRPLNLVNLNSLAKDTSSPDTYRQQIKDFLAQPPCDLVLTIHYAKLTQSQSPDALTLLLQQIAASALISIFEFRNFSDYFNHAILNRAYRYREVITTASRKIYVFCSNRYWYANGNIDQFDEPPKLTREWVGKDSGQRRYYFNADYILKHYQLRGKRSYKIMREMNHEIKFLSLDNARDGFAPKMMGYHMGKYECWILRKKASGMPLSELIAEGLPFDPMRVLTSILQQAIIIEQEHFYHTDLQPRNILVLDNGSGLLIDFGAIEFKDKHFLSGYFAFIMMGYEIFHRVNFPQPRKFIPDLLTSSHAIYLRWLKAILSAPCEKWTFALFLQFLQEAKAAEPICKIDLEQFQQWLGKIYVAIRKKQLRLRRLEMLMVKKLNHYLAKEMWPRRIIHAAWPLGLIVYDRITWPIKSLVKKAKQPSA